MNLEGKTALVMGGGRDIGASVSRKLGALGANVVVNYSRSEAEALRVVEEIKTAGGKAIAVQADATKSDDVSSLVGTTIETFGPNIDILVNVVGGLVARKTLDEMDEEFFDYLMRLNVNSVFIAMKAVVPHMKAGSSVINFASLAGRDGGGPGASAYATSKGAVMTFTRSMAKELGPKGIRVNSLCPGMISTTFHDTFSKPEARTKVAGMTPLQREGSPDEIGDIVAFLASSESSFITGANLDVNGGLFFS